MKNVVRICFILFCIFILLVPTCFAGEIQISSDDELKAKSDVIVKVNINFAEVDEEVYFLEGQLIYDKNIFETVSSEDISLLNGWHDLVFNSENGKFIVEGNYENQNDIVEIFNINFKTKPNINTKTTTIKLTNIKEIGESELENELEDTSINISTIEDNLSSGILPFTGNNSFIFVAIVLGSILLFVSIFIKKKKSF